MRFGKLCLAAVVAMGTIATSASAAITAFWQPIGSGNGSVGSMYPAAALTADPALANMQTWDLKVNTDGNWSSAGMRAVLPVGNTFYRSTSTGITKPEIITANREFWTYGAAPSDTGETNFINVLGGFPEGDPVSNGTANGTNIPGVFSLSWGDLVNDPPSPPGGYQIARLTFPLGMLFDVSNSGPNPSNTSQVNPDSTVTIPDIPEPATLGLLAGLGLVALRRRSA